MASINLKANFAVDSKHEAFFTGGKVQVSKSGEFIFCQCGTQVQVIDVNTGRAAFSIGQEDDLEVTSFTLSPDDEFLVLAYRNLTLKQWDWRDKKVTRTWKAIHTGPVSCMSFDPSSTLLATGGADATIKVWDVIKQYCTHNLRGHHGVVSVAQFHPDLARLQLVTAADDYKLRVWQLESSSCVAELDSHYSVITAVQFSPDGNTLYSAGRDNVLTVWNLEDFTKKKTIPVYEGVEGMVLLPVTDEGYPSLQATTQNPYLLTGGSKGELRVWDGSTGQCVHTGGAAPVSPQPPTQDPPSQGPREGDSPQAIVGLSHNGQSGLVTTVTYDHNILQYDLTDLTLHRQFAGYNDDVLDIVFVGRDESHIAVATNSQLIKVFCVSTWQCHILRGHTDIVMALHVCGDMLLSASKDKSMRVWRQVSDTDCQLQCVAVAHGHTHTVLAAAFSRIGPSFLVSGSVDLTLKVWPLPDEWASEDPVVQLHARVTEKAHDKDINSVTLSPNDKLIATGSQDKTAKLWNGSNLKLMGVFRGHKRGIWCVQFSPVDQCLATASADTSIKIWALSDFSCVKTFEGHQSSVLRVTFLCRGMQLLSSGSDGLLKLWTIKNNECVVSLDQHEDKVWALALNQAQDTVVTGAADSNIIVWKDVTETEQEEKRAKQADFILKEQTLQNLIQQKKYVKAIGLAITLEQPFRLLTIIKEILGGEEGSQELEDTLGKLREDQLDALLRFMSQWNTNSKHCHVAQYVLSVILRSFTPQHLLSFPNMKSSLQALLPYTERHYQRMGRLSQQATFVDYTWHSMRLVAGAPPSQNGSQRDAETSQMPSFVIDKTSTSPKIPGPSTTERSEERMRLESESDQETDTTTATEAQDNIDSTPKTKRRKSSENDPVKSSPELSKSGNKNVKGKKSQILSGSRIKSETNTPQSAKHKRRKSAVK